MITLELGNIFIKLVFENVNDKTIEWVWGQIHTTFDPLDPDRFRKRPFNLRKSDGSRVWDGRVKLCEEKDHLVPLGFYDRLMVLMRSIEQSSGIVVKVVDKRGSALHFELPREVNLDGHGKEKDLTLRDYQYEAVQQVNTEQSGIILNAVNAGKCKPGNSLLSTSKGVMTLLDFVQKSGIKDIKHEGEYNYNGNIKLINRYGEQEMPRRVFVNGIRKVFHINTDLGLSTVNTENHPMLTVNNDGVFTWKRTSDLKVGDLLVSGIDSNIYGDNRVFSEDDAYCLGLLVADGYYNTGNIKFTNNESILINFFSEWAYNLTGKEPRVETRFKTNGDYSSDTVNVRLGKFISTGELLKYCHLSRVKAGDKEIPAPILSAPKNVQLAFLSGYLECEMNFDLREDRNNIECTTKSKLLASQVQLMLLNMGIVCKIKPRKVKGYDYVYYRLTFRAIDSKKLVQLLSFKTAFRNKQKNTLISDMDSKSKRNPKGRSIPNGKNLVNSYIDSLPSGGIKGRASHEYRAKNSVSIFRGMKLITKYPQGDAMFKTRISELSNQKYFYTKIESIEYDGEQYTYDVEMPKTHSFLCDGLVNHNTASAVTLFKYLLPKINEGQHLLFIAPNKSIMNQIYLKYQHYLSEDIVGIWGDGKKDINRPIICATIQTLASAIKDPKTKPTRKRDKLLGRFAERYAPAILESGDPRSNLELLARNFHPNYKYEQDDIEELRNLYMNLQTSDDVKDYFEGVQKRYKKLLYSLNEEAYEKYYDAIDLLNNTRAVVCDEAHRAGAESYWKVFHYLNNARVKVGLTGTLDKTKKISMAHIRGLFGKDLVKVTNKQMIERGVSARPHIRLVPIDKPTDLEPRIQATMMAKGYSQLPTADLMSYQIAYDLGVVHNEYRNRIVAELAYKASSKLDKQAVLIMVTSIEHGELIGEQLDKLGAKYQFLQGKDDSDTREKAIDDIVSGKLKIVIATKIFEAGIDIPNLKVLILCDALKSYISVIQKIGRVLRVMPDKRDVFIFDIVDRTQNSLFKHAQDRVRYYKDEGFEVK